MGASTQQKQTKVKAQTRASEARSGQQVLAFVAEADARRRKAKRLARKRAAERRDLLKLGLARVPHRRRVTFERTMPVHVTLRLSGEVPKLRQRKLFRRIEASFAVARERLGARLTHFSVQDSHVHLIVEAENSAALSRAMQGMKIRIAKRLNALLGRTGQVFADRFHAHVLRTPAEVRNAVNYVLRNIHKHLQKRGIEVPADALDPFAAGPEQKATAGILDQVLALPRTWLLGEAVRRMRASPG